MSDVTSPRNTTPLWRSAAESPVLAPVDCDLDVDVAIVGGGITGLTAAWLLASAGRRVAVFERRRSGGGDTGHTTAHVTMVTDRRLNDLANQAGPDHAQAAWDAGLAAVDLIDTVVREAAIDCDFAWVDGYLHAPAGQPEAAVVDQLRAEADLAQAFGFDAEFVDHTPLVGTPGARFPNQARLHPGRYLAGLLAAIRRAGGHVYEQSAVETFSEAPSRSRSTVTPSAAPTSSSPRTHRWPA